jgi:hypothetical protein
MNLPKYIATTPTKTTRLGKAVNAWRGIIIKDSKHTEDTSILYLGKLQENKEESVSGEEHTVSSVGSDQNDEGEPEEWEGAEKVE